MPRVLTDSPLYDYWVAGRHQRELRRWRRNGSTGPTPHLRKQQVVRDFGTRFGMRVLVETGTYLGFMVRAMRSDFDLLYSTELDAALFARAKARFAGQTHIHILNGDSKHVLPELLSRIDQPALFWLDAHWSGGVTARGDSDTPILHELSAILSHRHGHRHVLLIDDARDFVGGEYPTIEGLRAHIGALQPLAQVTVAEEIIRITPPKNVCESS